MRYVRKQFKAIILWERKGLLRNGNGSIFIQVGFIPQVKGFDFT